MQRREFLASVTIVPALLTLRQADDEAGFLRLFDGKSLDGWSVTDGPESAFYVNDGAIVVHQGAGFPTWLRSAREYENFDFRGEFFVQGWTNSGIYVHAPEHGSSIRCGMKINIFQQVDAKPAPESMGSVFPLVAPLKVNVKSKGEWNTFRILMDWPRLQVWTNGEIVQDLDVETVPELRHRLRSGYLGLESLSYPIRFRELRVRELPSKVSWIPLYESAQDFAKWHVMSGKPTFQALGSVLHADGDGMFGTNETFRDFELQMYVRHVQHHNSGVTFGSPGKGLGRRYEIQLHDVEGAHYPTGSLYGLKHARYPRIEPERWWLFQLRVQDRTCLVRVNGDTVLEYDGLELPPAGRSGFKLTTRVAGHSSSTFASGGFESRASRGHVPRRIDQPYYWPFESRGGCILRRETAAADPRANGCRSSNRSRTGRWTSSETLSRKRRRRSLERSTALWG